MIVSAESLDFWVNLLIRAIVELGASFIVWCCSPEASFLKGKLAWCNWDVDELKAKKETIEADPAMLTTAMYGWPFQP